MNTTQSSKQAMEHFIVSDAVYLQGRQHLLFLNKKIKTIQIVNSNDLIVYMLINTNISYKSRSIVVKCDEYKLIITQPRIPKQKSKQCNIKILYDIMKDMAQAQPTSEEQIPCRFILNRHLQGKCLILDFNELLDVQEIQFITKDSHIELTTVAGVFQLTKDNQLVLNKNSLTILTTTGNKPLITLISYNHTSDKNINECSNATTWFRYIKCFTHMQSDATE